jgi:hypothetical protein
VAAAPVASTVAIVRGDKVGLAADTKVERSDAGKAVQHTMKTTFGIGDVSFTEPLDIGIMVEECPTLQQSTIAPVNGFSASLSLTEPTSFRWGAGARIRLNADDLLRSGRDQQIRLTSTDRRCTTTITLDYQQAVALRDRIAGFKDEQERYSKILPATPEGY